MNNFIWKNKIIEGDNPVNLLHVINIKLYNFKSSSGWDSTMNFINI